MKTFTQHYINNPYDIEQVNEDGYRYYKCDGYNFPSITTVLGKHPSNSWVDEWRNAVGEKRAEKVTRVATQIGTEVHDLAELYLSNKLTKRKLMQARPHARVRFNSLKKFLDQLDDIYFLERPLYSKTLRLAGTIDCLAMYKGKLTAIDFKTASGLRTKEHIQSYFAQVTFYAAAILEQYREIAKKIPMICIAIAVEGEDEPQVFVENVRENDNLNKRLTYIVDCVKIIEEV